MWVVSATLRMGRGLTQASKSGKWRSCQVRVDPAHCAQHLCYSTRMHFPDICSQITPRTQVVRLFGTVWLLLHAIFLPPVRLRSSDNARALGKRRIACRRDLRLAANPCPEVFEYLSCNGVRLCVLLAP